MTVLGYSYLFILILTLSLSLLLSPLVIKIAKKTNLNDLVNDRSAHTVPTPRGGGLIFIFSAGLVFLANQIFHFFIIPYSLSVILVLGFGSALLGFLDDKYSLPSWLRFITQLFLVAYPAMHLPLIFSNISPYLQYALYIISWVWFINLFNFMDGTDGYAAQEAMFILLFIMITSSVLLPVSMVLFLSVLAFLKVNYPAAKIFMGDAGSYFLGYLLFGLMLFCTTVSFNYFVPCLMISLLFTLDATYTLISRVIKRESFFNAHRSHWYQRLYNMGYSHKFIFWLGVFINTILLILSIVCFYHGLSFYLLFLSLFIIFLAGLFIKKKEIPI